MGFVFKSKKAAKMDKIHEKLQIIPEFALNINLNVNQPIHIHNSTIFFTTSSFLVEMNILGKQKIHQFHSPISNFAFSKDDTILAIESKQDSKVVFYDVLTMRKRRVLKEEQGIATSQFIDNKRYAILTEKNHLRVYIWESSLIDVECSLSVVLNPKLFQFDDGLVLSDKSNCIKLEITTKSIDQRKLKDVSIIQGSKDILLCQNQILTNNFNKLIIDPSVDLLSCNSVAILKDVMLISYPQSLLLLEFVKDAYIPLKDIQFSSATIAGMTNHKETVLVYTTCGGIFTFDHFMESGFNPILQSTLPAKIICSVTCARKPWIFYGLSDKTVVLYEYVQHKIIFTKSCLESCLSISLHPSSLFLLVSFPEKVTIYEVLHNDLIVFKDVNIRWCHNVICSNGGHLFALGINNVITLYDFWTVQPIFTFKGHSTNIIEIHFDFRDMYMHSTGTDGSLYTWNLLTNQRDNDHVLKGGLPLQTVWLTESTVIMLQSDRTIKEVVSNINVNQINLTVPCTGISFIKSASVVCANGTDGKSYIYKYPFNYTQVPLMILDGHTVAINSCNVVYNHGKIVTVDESNFITTWGIHQIDHVEPQFTDEIVVTKEEMDMQYQKLEGLKMKTEEKKMEVQYQLQVKKSLISKKLADVDKQHAQEMEMLRYEHDMEMTDYLKKEQDVKKTMELEEIAFNAEKQEIEAHYQQLLLFEYDKQQNLRTELQVLKDKYDLELKEQESDLQTSLEVKEKEYKHIEDALEAQCVEEEHKLQVFQHELQELTMVQEQEIDGELLLMNEEYEAKNKSLIEERFKVQAENQQVLRVCESLEKEIRMADQELLKFDQQEMDNNKELQGLQMELSKKQSDLKNIDIEINTKDDKINELKRKQQELEKYRFVMDYKLKELQDQVDPKKEEIEQLNGLIEQVKKDEVATKQKAQDYNQKIQDLTFKISLEKKEFGKEKEKFEKLQLFEKRMLYKFKLMTKLTNKKDLKMKMNELAMEFERVDDLSASILNENEQQALIKERDQLQKQIHMTQSRITSQERAHQQQMSKLLKENMTLVEQVQDQQQQQS